mmetsp:Transcript_22900/g.49532  ORF Transcript_22900/g.49532 Transcript_22900/m.49532 type:complete len:715 (+) Transcript_22900:3-2147(+)
MMGTMASGMGGITGGMTGGIVNGMQVGGTAGQQQRGGGVTGANNSPQPTYQQSNVMQYAAILLSQTYHRFGYTQLSLQATEEAVRVAQQSGDGECVCFANGWASLVGGSLGSGQGGGGAGGGASSVYASIGGLNSRSAVVRSNSYRPLAPTSSTANIGNNSVPNSRHEEEAMLRRCQARANERGLSSLAASTSLELARRMAYRRHGTGDGGGLGEASDEWDIDFSSLAWDSIQSAGRMPSAITSGTMSSAGRGATNGASGASTAVNHPTDIYNMTPTESVGILSKQNVAIASLWESTGHVSLASLSSCAALYGNGRETTNKPMGMMDRVLDSFTSGPGLDVWGPMDHLVNGGSRERDLKNQQRGATYATILNHHISLSEGNNNNSLVSSVATSTLHEWSTRSYDLSLAQGLNTLLANHAAFPLTPAAASSGALPNTAVECSLVHLTQSIHLSLQRREYDCAKICARRACWLSSRHGLIFHLGWNLLQLALIDLEASTTSSSKQQILPVERALPPLLECLNLSSQYSMDPLRAVALTTLAKVFLCMGRYKKARALLQAAMPLVMQHGHIYFQGEANLTCAKCYLAEASDQQLQRDSMIPSELQESALAQLKKATEHFAKIEDVQRLRQVYYLQARVCQSLLSLTNNNNHAKKKHEKQRDEAAKMFAQLTFEMRQRVGNSIVSSSGSGSKQWDVLRGVMITASQELQCCVLLKRQR